jgi:hypothetical protein
MPAQYGIIPRAVTTSFYNTAPGTHVEEWSVLVSYVRSYNEKVYWVHCHEADDHTSNYSTCISSSLSSTVARLDIEVVVVVVARPIVRSTFLPVISISFCLCPVLISSKADL